MRRLVAALLFLMLVNEGDPTTLYAKPAPAGFSPTGFAPFGWVQEILFDPLPFKVRPFDLIMLGVLIFASTRKSGKGAVVRPMRNALFLAIGTVVLWFVYGIATGGDARAASWQIYLMVSAILFAFTVSKIFTTPAHYESLTRVIIAAGIYRAVLCWYFFFAYVNSGHFETRPEYVTTHDDSVVWVISILAILIHILNKRDRGTMVRAVLTIALFLGAIQWNTRRLAWVSLVMGLVTAFFLLPKGKVKQRVTRGVLFAAPVLAIYVAVGWGRPEKIFAPLQSLASVSTQEDRSTKARNAENLGLVATVRQAGSLAGTGWGHGYIELTNKYSIASMELWPYIPHNSVLGLLAYTGVLGFVGYWLAFPTAVFLNARLAKLGKTEQVRNVGFACSTAMIVCGNQMYGDMGIFSLRTMYLLATTYAVAMRLPIVSGVWQGPAGPSAGPPRAHVATLGPEPEVRNGSAVSGA
jgi:hypothetical protein